MNFALEHNLGAKTVFPKIDVFFNRKRKQLQLFRLLNRGPSIAPDVHRRPHLLTFL